MIRNCSILFFLILSTFVHGQNYIFLPTDSLSVSIGGINISNAWAGGLNSIQVNKMRLDGDTTEDLILFDRTTAKLSTFLATGGKFIYAPEYEAFFPKIENWIYIADYNRDGKKDIFTSSNSTFSQFIMVYKNIGNATPRWTKAIDGMKSKDGNGYPLFDIQVGIADYPGITDIDSDGDLDIFVYNTVFGGIEFHKNNSVEKYSNSDSLAEFEKYYSCWGKFDIGYDCDNLVRINQTCNGYGGTHDNQRVEHNGSTIALFDLNGDGIKDMLLGDVGCNNITALTNTGTNLIGKITSIDPHFPPSASIDITSSPSVFYHDVDFDGIRDLTTSPNLLDDDLATPEFTQSLWYYKNTGTNGAPLFSFVKKDFLQDQMIEVGENAAPALSDYDHDGDLDLFVGTRGKLHGTNFYGTISLFENTGTREKAEFMLKTDDYLTLSGYNISRIKPGFTDLNNDGALDFYFFNTSNFLTGSASTQITYLLNQNTASQPFNFDITLKSDLTLSDPVSNYSYDSPTFSDIDNNGIKELLMGKAEGYLYCYSNTGTALAPYFTRISNFGGFISTYDRAYLACTEAQLNNKDTTELITVDNSGLMRIYPNFKSQPQKLIPTDSNIILNKVNQFTFPPYFGRNLNIAAGDLNGDTLTDLIVGTGGGGLIFLKNMRKKVPVIKPIPQDSVPVVDTTHKDTTTHIPTPPVNGLQNNLLLKIKVYPNPFNDEFIIYSPDSFHGFLINILGEKIRDIDCDKPGECKVNVNNLSKGIYFLKIYLHDSYITFKLSKQ